MRERDWYIAEIERIIGDPLPGDGKIEASFHTDDAVEAKDLLKRMTVMQRELRNLRREATTDMREIRGYYVSQRSNVEAGFFASAFGGRGGAARDRKNKREQSKAEEAGALAGHDAITAMIDDLLVQLDRAKHQTEVFARENAPAKPTPKQKTDPIAQIKGLKDLLDAGLITQEDYDAKKAELLARM